MAPGLSGVIVYEGPNIDNITAPNEVLNCMLTNDAASQLSCSWGFSIDSNTVQIFQQFGIQGQSFFLASGDSGAFTGAALPPADDPYVTVVGGTTLTTSGPGGSWVSEKVWNWFTTGEGEDASTGGISTTYTIPSWQSNVSMALNQGSTTMRNIPDVALTAGPDFRGCGEWRRILRWRHQLRGAVVGRLPRWPISKRRPTEFRRLDF